MFEREANPKGRSDFALQQDDLDKFRQLGTHVSAKTTLNWSEHCVECTMPTCFTSCSFYAPRSDLKCSRFEGGIRSVLDDSRGSIIDVTFKKWGKIEAVGVSAMMSKSSSGLAESADRFFSWLVNVPILSAGLKSAVQRKYYGLKNRLLKSRTSKRLVRESDAFILEVFNPQDTNIEINLTLRNVERTTSVYQQKLVAEAGYNRFVIENHNYSNAIRFEEEYLCQIDPVDRPETCRLLFGLMDFVTFKPENKPSNIKTDQHSDLNTPADKVKCVVWDLDNTLWNGVLIEDGADTVKPDSNMLDMIRSLDRKGILQSVASKNYEADALEKLKQLEIDHFFLYPQVNWGPKSQSIQKISEYLNIGINSLAFIDDQIFEREEVATAHPSVCVLDPADYDTWKKPDVFNVPETDESRRRREMYMEDMERQNVVKSDAYSGDYTAFLKDCEIVVNIEDLGEKNLTRAYELAQRTNQMNFSGNRYSVNELKDLINHDNLRPYIVRCKDRFGDYGIVGLVVVDYEGKQIKDMMFSCRIQSKMVDHGILVHFINMFGSDLSIYYRKTDRNSKAASIFEELSFYTAEQNENVHILRRKPDSKDLSNDVITIS